MGAGGADCGRGSAVGPVDHPGRRTGSGGAAWAAKGDEMTRDESELWLEHRGFDYEGVAWRRGDICISYAVRRDGSGWYGWTRDPSTCSYKPTPRAVLESLTEQLKDLAAELRGRADAASNVAAELKEVLR